LNWEAELRGWLEPFLERLGHKARRRMCPLYVSGLIGPGDRKSVQPMAERLAPNDYDQLHHFIAGGVWDLAPLERELLIEADRRSDRISSGTDEARDCPGGNRSHDLSWCPLRLCIGGRGLRHERAIPPAAHGSQACLGRWHPSSPQGVPRWRAADLANDQR